MSALRLFVICCDGVGCQERGRPQAVDTAGEARSLLAEIGWRVGVPRAGALWARLHHGQPPGDFCPKHR